LLIEGSHTLSKHPGPRGLLSESRGPPQSESARDLIVGDERDVDHRALCIPHGHHSYLASLRRRPPRIRIIVSLGAVLLALQIRTAQHAPSSAEPGDGSSTGPSLTWLFQQNPSLRPRPPSR
jgi:hypothetical protein